MLSKIVLENFMSHSRTEIELAPCLTVLTGPNNCGKSAVVAALQTVCGNVRSDFMVRHGAKESRVIVETFDGHSVSWQRLKGVVSFVVDGREVHRQVPDDLHDVLCLPRVETREGDKEFDVHFGEQKRPIFLLDEPGSRAATFFASSSDAEYLIRMQKLHREKTTARRTEARRIKAEIERLDRQIGSLEPVDVLEQRTKGIETLYDELRSREKSLTALTETIDKLKRYLEEAGSASKTFETLRTLNEPPALQPTSLLSESIARLMDARLNELQRHADVRALSTLVAPPTMHDTPALKECSAELGTAKRSLEFSWQLVRPLSILGDPPSQLPESELVEKIEDLSHAEAVAQWTRSLTAVFEPLQEAPDLQSTTELAGAVSELDSSAALVARAKGIASITNDLTDPPSIHDLSPLLMAIEGIYTARGNTTKANATSYAISCLTEPPEPTSTAEITGIMEAIRQESESVQLSTEALRLVEEDAISARTDIEVWLALNPTCPVCGGDVLPERLFGEAEAALG